MVRMIPSAYLRAEGIKNQIEDLEKTGLRREEEGKLLETNWRSLMTNMGQPDVLISTKTKKSPAHKNVLAGKRIFFDVHM